MSFPGHRAAGHVPCEALVGAPRYALPLAFLPRTARARLTSVFVGIIAAPVAICGGFRDRLGGPESGKDSLCQNARCRALLRVSA